MADPTSRPALLPPPGGPLVLGHRGNRRPGPDNSVTAVRAALAVGAAGVEIDVRLAADGVLRVGHDPLVGGEPPLTELLDAAAGRRVVCEVKNVPGEPGFDAPRCATAEALVGLLAGRADDVVVSSFDWFSLELVRRLAGPPTGFLLHPGVALRAGVAYAVDGGHAEVHPHWTAVGVRSVAAAHLAGVRVAAWTVRSGSRARKLARAGVDAVICDDPADVLAALD